MGVEIEQWPHFHAIVLELLPPQSTNMCSTRLPLDHQQLLVNEYRKAELCFVEVPCGLQILGAEAEMVKDHHCRGVMVVFNSDCAATSRGATPLHP
jgi:hypothetical protein